MSSSSTLLGARLGEGGFEKKSKKNVLDGRYLKDAFDILWQAKCLLRFVIVDCGFFRIFITYLFWEFLASVINCSRDAPGHYG